jgi:hypothetical protein
MHAMEIWDIELWTCCPNKKIFLKYALWRANMTLKNRLYADRNIYFEEKKKCSQDFF